MPSELTPHSSALKRRLPPWLKRPLGGGPEYARTADAIGQGHLHTICQEARCPNRGECWSAGTATFLILGDQCTRRCGFCSVKAGRPAGVIDPNEPARLAKAVARMGLRHVVITSVTRDDLPDGGASQFANCIQALRARVPGVTVEILTPDFRRCQDEALATLLPLAPLVLGHNVETVPRLYQTVRPGSRYADSLDLLRRAAAAPGIVAKSSIMLGLGETRDEVLAVIDDLISVGVKRMTIGQYLRPSAEQLDVAEFVTPETFSELGAEARRRGIPWVISQPFARSSYRAECSSPSVSEGQAVRWSLDYEHEKGYRTMEANGLKRTPLYKEHVAAGARMVPFGGWSMPVHYGSQIEEHHAVRRDVGLFDVSHMGQVFVQGPQAVELVNRIATRDITNLPDGGACYGALCREDGTLVDDLFVSRFTFDRILIVVNASTYDGDAAVMRKIAADAKLNAKLIPCAEKWAMIAVQGPRWKDVCLKALGRGDWERVEPLRIHSMTYGGRELLFSTTGYTGEAGVELICDPSVVSQLWRELIAAGGRPCGLAARDTLRLESGMNLSGQDFTAANNPFEVRMSWIVDLGKQFQGRDALVKLKKNVSRRQVGLLTEGRRIPRHNARILYEGQPVGEITSGGFSPTLDRPIAMAIVSAAQSKIGTKLEVELGGGATTEATVVKLPFYKRGN